MNLFRIKHKEIDITCMSAILKYFKTSYKNDKILIQSNVILYYYNGEFNFRQIKINNNTNDLK